MRCNLPKSLRPTDNTGDIVRIGSEYDGGYICCLEDVKKTDVIISGGINNNWDFEIEILTYNKVPIYAYDASIGLLYYLKQILEIVPKIHRWNLMWHRLKNLIYYLAKYPRLIQIYRKFLGIKNHENFVDFEEVLSLHADKNVLLKLDIEGWEYRLLPSIKKHAASLNCVIIEFHDVDLHIDVITSFVENLNMRVISTAVNTYSSIGMHDYPTTIEITLSKSTVATKSNSYESFIKPNDKSHSKWEVEYV